MRRRQSGNPAPIHLNRIPAWPPAEARQSMIMAGLILRNTRKDVFEP